MGACAHAGVAGTVFPSGNEDGECVGGPHRDAASAVAAVVSITFNRVAYLQRHLDSLLAIHGSDPANRQILLLMSCRLGQADVVPGDDGWL